VSLRDDARRPDEAHITRLLSDVSRRKKMKILKRTSDEKMVSIGMMIFSFGLGIGSINGDSTAIRIMSMVLLACGVLHLIIAVYKFRTPFLSSDENTLTFHIPFHKYTASVDDIADIFYRKKAGMHYGYFEVHFRNRKPLKVSNGTKVKHHERIYDFFTELKIPVQNFDQIK